MKRKIYAGLIAVGSVTLMAGFLLLKTPAQRNDHGQTELKALRAKVEQLERNTAALQREVGKLREIAQAPIAPPHQTFMAPSALPSARGTEVPPGWKPFEFNGMTYYLTPLKQEVDLANSKAE